MRCSSRLGDASSGVISVSTACGVARDSRSPYRRSRDLSRRVSATSRFAAKLFVSELRRRRPARDPLRDRPLSSAVTRPHNLNMNARANGKVPKQGPPARLAAAWREHLAVRIAELETREKRLADPDFKKLAGDLLLRARGAIERRANPLAAWTGTDVERAWVSTHAAEVALVRGGSLDDVTGNLPSLLAGCGAIIPADSRVAALKKVVDAGRTVTPLDRTLAADTLQSASKVWDAQHARVRSFGTYYSAQLPCWASSLC
jgi:hypothetical protein